jgi:hypothetical protein
MWAVTAVDAEGLSAQTNRTAYVEAGSVVRLCRDGRTVAEGRSPAPSRRSSPESAPASGSCSTTARSPG